MFMIRKIAPATAGFLKWPELAYQIHVLIITSKQGASVFKVD